jgi:hypothetical protein
MQSILKQENKTFWFIIFIASVLRLYNYWNWSYSHDEIGAFVRLYPSFSELISQGVRDHDTHPAFVQIFLWLWTKLFGLSEAAVRLPFVIAGIGSVALLYFIAKQWFGYATACFSSLSLATLDFPILYSQLARPYSFGLFFCLLTVWFWTNFLFGSDKKMYQKAILYGLSTALCMLTHYFAFFFALIIAVTGLFFLKKETWKMYLLAGAVAILIFIPHLSISLHQFGMGGVGEWLSKPGKDYLWKFILYSFNNSPIVVITLAIILVLSILVYHLDMAFSKFQLICIVWFLLPFAAGYYYSVYVNPVLQYSTLLFSFPFLLLFIFSFLKEKNEKFNNISLASLGIVLLFSTVIEQNSYRQEYFGVFKEINQAVVDQQKKYGKENITTVLNTSAKDIFDFYFKRMDEPASYDFFAGDDSSFAADMLKKIDKCKTPYFIYGWSNFRSPYEIPEIIKRKYPCILYDEKHFNSQVTLFGKNDSCKRDTVFYTNTGFESMSSLLSFDTTKIDTQYAHSGKHSLFIEPKNKYCITYKTTVKHLFKENTCVNLSAWIYTQGKFNSQLVMDIGQPTGKRDWQAKLLPKFITQKGQWNQVFATFELPADAYPDDEVKIHLWNPEKNSFFLDDVTISSFEDSKYDYYAPSFRK